MKNIIKVKISDFFQPDPIPKHAYQSVKKLLHSSFLFRYSPSRPQDNEAALMERNFCRYLGVKYALGLNSCSSALLLAMKCCGVKPGDKVLVPAFTFTAVPSTIIHAGAQPILVEIDKRYCLDLDDLKEKITPDTKYLLLSHMRGHTSDLDKIVKICHKNHITLIEDAAHSLGILWRNKPVGTYGKVGCYSFQSYKIINAGEGGLLVTNDEEIIVKAILLSGTFENHYEKHFIDSKLFEKHLNLFPLYNLRMNNVTATIIRSQIKNVEKKVKKYNINYEYLTSTLSKSKYIYIPEKDPRERMSPDTIQFHLQGLTLDQARIFMDKLRAKGISAYVFGVHSNNSRVFWNWKYLGNIPELKKTRHILEYTCDIRLPLFFGKPQLNYISSIILSTLDRLMTIKS